MEQFDKKLYLYTINIQMFIILIITLKLREFLHKHVLVRLHELRYQYRMFKQKSQNSLPNNQ